MRGSSPKDASRFQVSSPGNRRNPIRVYLNRSGKKDLAAPVAPRESTAYHCLRDPRSARDGVEEKLRQPPSELPAQAPVPTHRYKPREVRRQGYRRRSRSPSRRVVVKLGSWSTCADGVPLRWDAVFHLCAFPGDPRHRAPFAAPRGLGRRRLLLVVSSPGKTASPPRNNCEENHLLLVTRAFRWRIGGSFHRDVVTHHAVASTRE